MPKGVKGSSPLGLSSRRDGKQDPRYWAAYYSANRDRIRENQAKWRQKTGWKRSLDSVEYRQMAVNLLRQRDGDRCEICGKLIRRKWSIDHILQVALGGTHAADNLRLTHLACNFSRPKKRGRVWRNNGFKKL